MSNDLRIALEQIIETLIDTRLFDTSKEIIAIKDKADKNDKGLESVGRILDNIFERERKVDQRLDLLEQYVNPEGGDIEKQETPDRNNVIEVLNCEGLKILYYPFTKIMRIKFSETTAINVYPQELRELRNFLIQTDLGTGGIDSGS